MRRRIKQRAVAIIMSVLMVFSLMPTDLLGGGISG